MNSSSSVMARRVLGTCGFLAFCFSIYGCETTGGPGEDGGDEGKESDEDEDGVTASGGGSGDASGGSSNSSGGSEASGGSGPGVTPVPESYPRGMSAGCGKPLPGGLEGGDNDPRRVSVLDTEPDAAWLEEFDQDAAEYEDRTYRVRVPGDYDNNHPYTVNIVGGGCGGTSDSWGGLGAWPRNDESNIIHVHPAMKDGCYLDDGINNPEVRFMEKWWEEFTNNYCVDLERVFITGWSSGAWESYSMGCAFPGTIRGMGASAGGLRQRRPECGGPVAAIIVGDAIDNENPIHDTVEGSSCTGTEAEGCWMGRQICTGDFATRDDFPQGDPRRCVDEGQALVRDEYLRLNGCVGTESEPWGGTIDDIPLSEGGFYRYTTFLDQDPGEQVPQGSIDAVKDYFPVPDDGVNNLPACQKYTGCPANFPVVYCVTYDDGHGPHSVISEREGDDGRTGFQRFFEDDVPRYAEE